MWLDRGEFDSIIEYLRNEATRTTAKELAGEAYKDIKKIWTGGPESTVDKIIDAETAISAFMNATIFENPALFRLCMNAIQAGRGVGIS
jgi:hypothetical protein